MSATKTMEQGATERLVQGIDNLVDEAEKLATPSDNGAEQGAAWERLAQQIRTAKQELQRLEERAATRAKHAAHATDIAVHQHPYTAMGAAAAVGVLIGLLIARR